MEHNYSPAELVAALIRAANTTDTLRQDELSVLIFEASNSIGQLHANVAQAVPGVEDAKDVLDALAELRTRVKDVPAASYATVLLGSAELIRRLSILIKEK